MWLATLWTSGSRLSCVDFARSAWFPLYFTYLEVVSCPAHVTHTSTLTCKNQTDTNLVLDFTLTCQHPCVSSKQHNLCHQVMSYQQSPIIRVDPGYKKPGHMELLLILSCCNFPLEIPCKSRALYYAYIELQFTATLDISNTVPCCAPASMFQIYFS